MRTKHHWNVTLQREDGEIIESPFASYWDPTQEGTKEAVLNAAPIEASMRVAPVRGENGPRRVHFAPIACALVPESSAKATASAAAVTDDELLAGAADTA